MKIVLAQDGTLLHLSVPCSKKQVIVEAAVRLEDQRFCFDERDDFLRLALANDPESSGTTLTGFAAVTVSTAQRAVRANRSTKFVHSPSEHWRPLMAETGITRRWRIASALTRKIEWHLVFPDIGKYWGFNEAPFRVSHETVHSSGLVSDLGDYHLEVSAPGAPNDFSKIAKLSFRRESIVRIGEPTRSVAGYVIEWDRNAIKECCQYALINKAGYCLCCGSTIGSNVTRHGRGPRHAERFGRLLRVIEGLFSERAIS